MLYLLLMTISTQRGQDPIMSDRHCYFSYFLTWIDDVLSLDENVLFDNQNTFLALSVTCPNCSDFELLLFLRRYPTLEDKMKIVPGLQIRRESQSRLISSFRMLDNQMFIESLNHIESHWTILHLHILSSICNIDRII